MSSEVKVGALFFIGLGLVTPLSCSSPPPSTPRANSASASTASPGCKSGIRSPITAFASVRSPRSSQSSMATTRTVRGSPRSRSNIRSIPARGRRSWSTSPASTASTRACSAAPPWRSSRRVAIRSIQSCRRPRMARHRSPWTRRWPRSTRSSRRTARTSAALCRARARRSIGSARCPSRSATWSRRTAAN
jgi:hypothetical protein